MILLISFFDFAMLNFRKLFLCSLFFCSAFSVDTFEEKSSFFGSFFKGEMLYITTIFGIVTFALCVDFYKEKKEKERMDKMYATMNFFEKLDYCSSNNWYYSLRNDYFGSRFIKVVLESGTAYLREPSLKRRDASLEIKIYYKENSGLEHTLFWYPYDNRIVCQDCEQSCEVKNELINNINIFDRLEAYYHYHAKKKAQEAAERAQAKRESAIENLKLEEEMRSEIEHKREMEKIKVLSDSGNSTTFSYTTKREDYN